jgi:hypothetical protein
MWIWIWISGNTVSFHIPVWEERPSFRVWVFPSLVPGRFGEFAAGSIDRLDGCAVVDGVMIRCDPDDGAVTLV